MVHGVSFGNTDLAALMAAPPASAAGNTSAQDLAMAPIAAQEMQGDTLEKSGHPVAKTVGTLAVLAGLLALGRGKLAALKNVDLTAGIKNAEGFMSKIKFVLAKGGQYVIDGFNKCKNGVMKLFKRGEQVVEKAAPEAEKAA